MLVLPFSAFMMSRTVEGGAGPDPGAHTAYVARNRYGPQCCLSKYRAWKSYSYRGPTRDARSNRNNFIEHGLKTSGLLIHLEQGNP